MGDLFTALDLVYGILLAAGLAMTAFAHKELKVARLLVSLGGALLIGRWIMWSLVTDSGWLARSFVGALVGALVLGGFPAFWHWSAERGKALIAPSNSSQQQEALIVGSLRFVRAFVSIIHKQDESRTSAQMAFVIHNATSVLIEVKTTLAGEANGKPGPQGAITFNSLVYPDNDLTFTYDRIDDIPIPDKPTFERPYFHGWLDYKIEYRISGDPSYPRITSRRLLYQLTMPPKGGPSGTLEEFPITVGFANEVEK
jgi:hypothetical protein